MTAETATTQPKSKNCVHHWIVDPADGPTSRGHCKYCGSKRSFANSTETADEELVRAGEAPQTPTYRWR
jgi:hypothetical protein